jgi:hypothetical protein
MDHRLLLASGFWLFLLRIDKELAGTARQKGCSCGSRLHCANYPRKPRGGPTKDLAEEYALRLSFCCAREGCRKRVTPASVRFLGRKVYLGAVVVLVAAMRQGASPRRVQVLAELFDVDPRTIARWQVFWREQFPQTAFWRVERGRFLPLIQAAALPRALLEEFLRHAPDPDKGWQRLLQFLSPITLTGGLKIDLSP